MLILFANFKSSGIYTNSKADRFLSCLRWPFLLLPCLLSSFSLSLSAQNLQLTLQEQAWIAAHPVVKIGVAPNFAPYEFVNPAGQYMGMGADYLKLISSSTGLVFQLMPNLTWEQVMAGSRQKTLDVHPVLTNTLKRRQFLLFTQSYINDHYVVITRNNYSELKNELALQGKAVSLVRGYSATELALKNIPDVVPVYVDSELESLLAVAGGDVSATVGHLGSLIYLMQKNNLSNLKVAAVTAFQSHGMGMGVRDDWPELQGILDKALRHVTDAQRNEINQRWINFEQTPATDYSFIRNYFIVVVLLLLVILVWNRTLSRKVSQRTAQVQQELKRRIESETRFLTLFENAPEAIVVADIETGRFEEANVNAERLFGLSREQLNQFSIWQLSPSVQSDGVSSRNRFVGEAVLAMEGKSPIFEWTYQRDQQSDRPCEMRLVKMPTEGRNLVRCSLIDIADRKAAEQDLILAAKVFSNVAEGIVIADGELNILRVNQAFSEITAYSSEDVLGQDLCEFMTQGDSESFGEECRKTLIAEGVWNREVLFRSKTGGLFPTLQHISVVRDSEGGVAQLICLFSDISEEKKAEERLQKLAHYDVLTGLRNRVSFSEILEHAVSLANAQGQQVALLFMDLDHFKNINDSMGHPAGDTVLREVARRVSGEVREEDTVARLGGDEFVILLENLKDPELAANVADKLIKAMRPTFIVEGKKLNITISIGISLQQEDCNDPTSLIKNADSAMYHAKEAGRNNYQFYTPKLTAKAVERMTLGAELRHALEQSELEVWFQPQYYLETGVIFGAEALLRWNHPDKGFIPPDKFIPIAEEQGFISVIGNYALQTACARMKQWLDEGIELSIMAVNVSGYQMYSRDFYDQVSNALAQHELAPHYLQLEMTESVIMKRTQHSIELMERLKTLGVSLAVDDFGTGYSSLSYLKQMPIDKLKIDQSFVMDIPHDENDEAIVRAVIALAHSLNIEVISEGVETAQQEQFLCREGCLQGQGNLRGKSVPADMFTEFITSD